MTDRLDRIARLLGELRLPRISRGVGLLSLAVRQLRRFKSAARSPEHSAPPRAEGDRERAGPADNQPQPSDFGPAQGGYYSASSPDAAVGGKGIFGPDATNSRDQVGQSALNGGKLGGAS